MRRHKYSRRLVGAGVRHRLLTQTSVDRQSWDKNSPLRMIHGPRLGEVHHRTSSSSATIVEGMKIACRRRKVWRRKGHVSSHGSTVRSPRWPGPVHVGRRERWSVPIWNATTQRLWGGRYRGGRAQERRAWPHASGWMSRRVGSIVQFLVRWRRWACPVAGILLRLLVPMLHSI